IGGGRASAVPLKLLPGQRPATGTHVADRTVWTPGDRRAVHLLNPVEPVTIVYVHHRPVPQSSLPPRSTYPTGGGAVAIGTRPTAGTRAATTIAARPAHACSAPRGGGRRRDPSPPLH